MSPEPAQPAAVRFLREQDPAAAPLAEWTRDVLLEAAPELTERVYAGWGGVGFHHPDAGYVCAVFPWDGVVRLAFEHGAALPNAAGRLTGDGRQVRALPVDHADAATAAAIRTTLEEAIVHRLR